MQRQLAIPHPSQAVEPLARRYYTNTACTTMYYALALYRTPREAVAVREAARAGGRGGGLHSALCCM